MSENKSHLYSLILCFFFKQSQERDLTDKELVTHDSILCRLNDVHFRGICETVGDSAINSGLFQLFSKDYDGRQLRFHYDNCKSNKFYEIFIKTYFKIDIPNSGDCLEIVVGALCIELFNIDFVVLLLYNYYQVVKDRYFIYTEPSIIISAKTPSSYLWEYCQRCQIPMPTTTFEATDLGWECILEVFHSDGNINIARCVGENKQSAKQKASKRMLEKIHMEYKETYVLSILDKLDEKLL